ncbi:MAG: IS200/IS605 family transposase [Chitinophagales bacterium]|jgi:REP element-mobilizing transposase RayT
MANTYTQIYLQFVFAVSRRQNLLTAPLKDPLEKVMCGLTAQHKAKVLAVYCNPDHIHLLVSMPPSLSPSKLMETVKTGSSNWLNTHGGYGGSFRWQKGYGSFSYSKSHVSRVARYIHNQHQHHQKLTFKEEYLALLERYEISYQPEYLFEWLE